VSAPGGLGVVIGKFLPPHAGHSHLIEAAAAASDQVLAIVCAREGDPIPAATRAQWLREIHPGVEVAVTPDDIPDHDPRARAEEVSRAWAERTRLICTQRYGRGPQAVFTSEEYGPRYARYLGAEHVSVDAGRRRYPVSGTAVRADPYAAWQFLHPARPRPVRAAADPPGHPAGVARRRPDGLRPRLAGGDPRRHRLREAATRRPARARCHGGADPDRDRVPLGGA
jgi:NadR type nicotinamide-nucleotide adenylyltransferase